MSYLGVLIVLNLLILVHEAGHLIAAKLAELRSRTGREAVNWRPSAPAPSPVREESPSPREQDQIARPWRLERRCFTIAVGPDVTKTPVMLSV